jgi:hypothetical protein
MLISLGCDFLSCRAFYLKYICHVTASREENARNRRSFAVRIPIQFHLIAQLRDSFIGIPSCDANKKRVNYIPY